MKELDSYILLRVEKHAWNSSTNVCMSLREGKEEEEKKTD